MAKKKDTDRDKAAKEMQRYIRVKRCLEATGLAFVGYCITCNRKFHIENLEAGHFMSGRRNAVLFDVMGLYNQCGYCNRFLNHGCHKKYRKALVRKHGEEWVVNRERRAKRAIPNVNIDFKKLRAGIKRMTEKMYRKHGFRTHSEILQRGR